MSVSGVTSSYSYYNYQSSASSPKDIINQLVRNYTYTDKGVFQPKLDKNDDGLWDRSEVLDYSIALKKATGRTIDVDGLVEAYGNEDGKIDAKGQSEIMKDDALQLSGLQADWVRMNTNAVSSSKETSADDDLLASISATRKATFSRVMQRADVQQQLISSFAGAGMDGSDMVSLLNSSNDLMVYGKTLRSANKESDFYSVMLGQLMNFTV